MVNFGISDLWFNHNHGYAWKESKEGGWYDEAEMTEEAVHFIRSLVQAGVQDPPSAEELVADFFRRL